MNTQTNEYKCPHCQKEHPKPTSRNRFKCKTCTTWLQINLAGDALHDFHAASNAEYLAKRGYTTNITVPVKSNLATSGDPF
jgi:transposase-like protein